MCAFGYVLKTWMQTFRICVQSAMLKKVKALLSF